VVQQRFQGRDERHEQGAALLAAEAPGGFRKTRRQRPCAPRGAQIVDLPFRT
jgi:hypothetical protein